MTNSKNNNHFSNGALAGNRYRVIVSTDIGGTDPDDFQSMVHLFLYADCLDIEGLISSPFGQGRKEDVLTVIDCYEKDYDKLKKYADTYPQPDSLRKLAKQGVIEVAPYAGFREATEASELIIDCARRDDSRPLYILGWGGIEDIAQALHDAPDIVPKLRVYWIGGPNKKWSPDAYQYIAENHSELHIIETNATYRGWFTGGNQDGQWENTEFVKQHIAGRGALGDFFNTQLQGTIKMGDTPSVASLLKGTPEDPSLPSWGGSFVRAWERPCALYNRLTTTNDRIEEFGILELALPLGVDLSDEPEAQLIVQNQSLIGHVPGDGTIRFRFCPKASAVFDFTIRSNVPSLDGQTGGITSFPPDPDQAKTPSSALPNWWTDNPSPEFTEFGHVGIKTVSQWRQEYLESFAERIARCNG